MSNPHAGLFSYPTAPVLLKELCFEFGIKWFINGTPEAGDILNVLPSEAKAREISLYREQNLKNKKNTIGMGSSLDQLLAKAKEDERLRVHLQGRKKGRKTYRGTDGPSSLPPQAP